jgi:hypothetical protein
MLYGNVSARNQSAELHGRRPVNDEPHGDTSGDEPTSKPLTAAARRALAEAEERRVKAAEAAARPTEVGGREGPDPARYGDWEKGGIVSDF